MPKPVPSEAAVPENKGASQTLQTPKSFEVAIAELEGLVADMESGDLTLEQSLAAHKRGLELARFCQDTLANAEAQVRVLEGEMLRAWPSDSSSSNTMAPPVRSAHFGSAAESDSSDD